MDRNELTAKRCVPCEGGVAKLGEGEVCALQPQVPGWTIEDGKLRRTFRFKDFVQAMAFVNWMAELAEAEGHHPDFCVHYATVDLTIWTHAIGGLSENDFILAAKIGDLPDAS
jgi:4a-hydroxytetrahydrobiopterin dehydratase